MLKQELHEFNGMELEREIVNKVADRNVGLYRDGISPKEQLTKRLMTDRAVFNLGYNWEHTDR